MVYLKVNLWNLKMYTATVFEKGALPTLEKYFKEKYTSGMKCERQVTDKMVKWSDTRENVSRQLQILQI
jgi:hypothetical protein